MLKFRIIWFLLLSVWIFQSFGVYLLFQTEIGIHHYRQQNKISEKSLNHIIRFTFRNENQIHWKNRKKEMEVDGKLFDIVKIEKTNKSILISCISDKYEDNLCYKFKKIHHQKKDENIPAKRKFNTLKYAPNSQNPFDILVSVSDFKYSLQPFYIKRNSNPEIYTPPPEV